MISARSRQRTPRRRGGGVGGFSPKYKAYLKRVKALGYADLPLHIQVAENELLVSIEQVWPGRFETLNLYLSTSLAGFVDIMNPTHVHSAINGAGALQFSSEGVKSDGVAVINQNLKLNRRSEIELANTTLVSVSEDSTDIAAARALFGARSLASTSATAYRFSPLLTAATGNRGAYGASDNFSNTNHKGDYGISNGPTESILYKDYEGPGVGVKDVHVRTPVAPDLTNDILFLARNGSGTNGAILVSEPYTKYSFLIANVLGIFTDADFILWKKLVDRLKFRVGLLLTFGSDFTWGDEDISFGD
jgi:hypothetical protein